ncbi:MAG TPA: alanine dehydrogenase [bacterium]|nr:alanine dehydrogenase [bacterium]HOL34798.1 alanine dehydrogenase [bacterium]HPP08260.1 alanine dehydrogenase [bacterium]
MIIGLLKEIKTEEYRVGLAPMGVKELVKHGHKVLVENNAGTGSTFADTFYKECGAEIVSREYIFESAELIVKVKEPQSSEIAMMKPGQIVFTFFHFASNPEMARALASKKVTCIAYELIEENGIWPILKPMSEIAGKLSIQQGMKYLEKEYGGKGVLLMGTETVPPGRVVVLGGGVVGSCASDVAISLNAKLTIIEKSPEKREFLKKKFPGCSVMEAKRDIILECCQKADIIVGAVLIPGHRPPILIRKSDLEVLEKGTVLVDVSIDEGGVFETSRPTTHKEPIFIDSGIVHYCVPNMPGIVPKTSTIALSFATMPYLRILADKGESALKENLALKSGCAILRGDVIHPAIKEIVNS